MQTIPASTAVRFNQPRAVRMFGSRAAGSSPAGVALRVKAVVVDSKSRRGIRGGVVTRAAGKPEPPRAFSTDLSDNQNLESLMEREAQPAVQTEADLKQKQADAAANQPDNNSPVTTGQLIGSTPLLDLSQYSLNPNVKIMAKCEYLNPSGSIKDRIAQHIINQAEASGDLRPGMTVVAATSGNTGAAIAMACALRGYDYIVITNEKTSKEKVDAMKAYGGEVIVSPSGVAPDHPDHYQMIEDRLCRENPGTYYGVDQYNNPYNAEAYEATLGPEIWRQTSGLVTHFVAGGSTGGTVSGTGRYLKSENADVRVVMADPKGSVFWDHVVKGVPAEDVCVTKSWEMEGVGKDSIPGCFDIDAIDGMVRGNDEDAFAMCREVAANDGLLLGGSAGLNLHAARVLSASVDDRATIVTVFPDNGVKYLSKIYNDSWLQSKGLEGAQGGNGAVSPDVDEKSHESKKIGRASCRERV